jgi:hypothetical protein
MSSIIGYSRKPSMPGYTGEVIRGEAHHVTGLAGASAAKPRIQKQPLNNNFHQRRAVDFDGSLEGRA